MVTLTSNSPEETQAIGEAWAREAGPGWVIGLSGDLGAGKTQLVKGLARGLGSSARVHSPTFTLLNQYGGGRLPLFHLDLYRLSGRDEVFAAGLEEYVTRPEGVAVVEWMERWLGPARENGAGSRLRLVTIETVSETARRITYEDSGA